MTDTAIKVENLSKRYRIGHKEESHDTLFGALKSWMVSPLANFRRLRKLSHFEDNGDSGDIIWALKDVSFEVKHGEVIGIIGRNGAGKSTLLKILSQITEPTSGRAVINGRIASLLEVGTGFHPELTGRENIYLNGTILGMTKQEVNDKFDEIVSFSEVEKFIDTPVKRYSSGMRVRLAFAVAAHLEPEILLIDEVLAVGDASFQKKCLGKIGDVAKEGKTVLFVSHNMPAVLSLCSKAFILQSGEMTDFGITEDIVSNYLRNQGSLDSQDIMRNTYRKGNGSMRFSKWSLIDKILGEGRKVRCNQPCSFHLHYISDLPSTKLRNIQVAIVIKDYLDQRILTGSTHFLNSNFKNLPSSGTIICNFDFLPLMPDIYKTHLSCFVNGELADLIEDAGKFEVVADDVFGTGRFPEKKYGRFILPHSWRLKC